MENDKLIQRIEELEKRIQKLESNKVQLFGRSYTQIGDKDSDFLIKTRGQLKVQYGTKFIDIIKDGKVNVPNQIKSSSNEESQN